MKKKPVILKIPHPFNPYEVEHLAHIVRRAGLDDGMSVVVNLADAGVNHDLNYFGILPAQKRPWFNHGMSLAQLGQHIRRDGKRLVVAVPSNHQLFTRHTLPEPKYFSGNFAAYTPQ